MAKRKEITDELFRTSVQMKAKTYNDFLVNLAKEGNEKGRKIYAYEKIEELVENYNKSRDEKPNKPEVEKKPAKKLAFGNFSSIQKGNEGDK